MGRKPGREKGVGLAGMGDGVGGGAGGVARGHDGGVS